MLAMSMLLLPAAGCAPLALPTLSWAKMRLAETTFHSMGGRGVTAHVTATSHGVRAFTLASVPR